MAIYVKKQQAHVSSFNGVAQIKIGTVFTQSPQRSCSLVCNSVGSALSENGFITVQFLTYFFTLRFCNSASCPSVWRLAVCSWAVWNSCVTWPYSSSDITYCGRAFSLYGQKLKSQTCVTKSVNFNIRALWKYGCYRRSISRNFSWA
jgi:hypothetical protein